MRQSDYTPDEWTVYLRECVEQFYDGRTGADIRAEVEDEMLAFRQADWSWRLCRHIMLQSGGDVRLQWLAASVLHDTSTRNLSVQDAHVLRLEMWELLVDPATTEVAREKLASAIVGVALGAWPSAYADLIPQVQTAASVLPHAALMVVRGIVEELESGSGHCRSRHTELNGAIGKHCADLCKLAFAALHDGATTTEPTAERSRAAVHGLAVLARLAAICNGTPIISSAVVQSAASAAQRAWPATADASRVAESTLHFLADVFLLRRVSDIPSPEREAPIDQTAAEVLRTLLAHMALQSPEVPSTYFSR